MRVKIGIGKPSSRTLLTMVIAGVYLLGYFFPGHLWFTSAVTMSPLGVQVLFWVLICLLCFEESLTAIEKVLSSLGRSLFENPPLKTIFRSCRIPRAAILILLGAVLFFIFRARHFIWGDSHVILRYVRDFSAQGSTVARRYFVTLLYSFFVKLFSLFGAIDWPMGDYIAIMTLHALFGGIFLWIASEFGDLFGRDAREKAAIFLVIAFSGLALLFTHIELYAPGAICAAWFLLTFLRNLQKKGASKYLFIVPLTAAILFQPLYIYLLVLLPLILIRKVDKRIIALGVILAAVGLLCFLGSGLDENTKRSCLPMSFPGYFLSSDHLWLLANFFLFTTPAIFLLLLKFERRPGEEIQYLSAFAITSAVMLVPLFFELGALDWDVAMTLLVPVIFLAAYRTARAKPLIRAFIVGAAVIIFCVGAYLNIDKRNGEIRAEELLLKQRTPYFLFTRSPLDRLVMINIYQPKEFWNPYKVNRWGEKLVELEPQNSRPYLYLMSFNLWNGRKSWAAHYAFEAIHSGKVGKDMIPRLMRFFEESLVQEVPSMEELNRLYADGGPFSLDRETIIELRELAYSDAMPDPNREKSLDEILRICLFMNQMAVAGHFDIVDAVYDASKKIYPRSGNLELIYGAILLMAKRPIESNNALRRSYDLRGDTGSVFSNMGLVCAMMNDLDKGLIAVEKAIEARPWLANYRCNYTLLLSEKFGVDSAVTYLTNYAALAERNGFPSEAYIAREFLQSFAKSRGVGLHEKSAPKPDAVK